MALRGRRRSGEGEGAKVFDGKKIEWLKVGRKVCRQEGHNLKEDEGGHSRSGTCDSKDSMNREWMRLRLSGT